MKEFKKDDIIKCIKDIKWSNSTTGQYSYSFRKGEKLKVYGINTNFGLPKLMLNRLGKPDMFLTEHIDSFELITEG